MQENVPLAPFTTLGIGGPARWYVRAEDEAAIYRAIDAARQRDVPWMVLGGGSNVLIADEGFPGVVVHIATRGILEDGGVVRVAAGEEWDPFVAACVQQGRAGVECLSGIPGRVGATPIQNVGAYGQEVRETIVEVRALDTQTGREQLIGAEACQFAYRDSRFKSREPGRHVVLEVAYRLRPGGAPSIRYGELSRALEGIAEPMLQQVRDAIIAIRRRKSMVLDPADPNSRSVGSFFTNPIVDVAAAERCPESPRFPAPDGKVKLSAAWLIEHAGFSKGFRLGRAGLSANHTLAIVNLGGATARDVLALKAQIIARVQDAFGITLVPEPVFVGG